MIKFGTGKGLFVLSCYLLVFRSTGYYYLFVTSIGWEKKTYFVRFAEFIIGRFCLEGLFISFLATLYFSLYWYFVFPVHFIEYCSAYGSKLCFSLE